MSLTFKILTRQAMRKLLPGESLFEHGILFIRAANGDGIFKINVMVEGKRIHRSVGRESAGTTRTQAEEYVEKLRQDAKDNRLKLPSGRKYAIRFNEAAEKYLENLAMKGGKNIDKKKAQLKLHLIPFFGEKILTDISSSDIDIYKNTRLKECILPKYGCKSDPTTTTKPATVNRELATLSHLMNTAVEMNLLNTVPPKIKRLKENNGRIEYLTTEQIERLLDAAKADQNRQIYPFILIGLNTSMRSSEILNIRKQDVDIEKRLIHIPKAKAGTREQPITRTLATFLADYLQTLQPGTEWLFPSPAAKSGHVETVSNQFRRCVGNAGLDQQKITPHVLRHTAITHLVQSGVDLPTVKRISGHKTLAMVERYSHQNGAHITKAMDCLDAILA